MSAPFEAGLILPRITETLPPPDDREARQHLLAGADALVARLIDLASAILDAALPDRLSAAVRRHLVTPIRCRLKPPGGDALTPLCLSQI